MLTKEKIIQSINELPERFSVDDLFDRIILLEKIETGINQSNAGQTFTTEEARQKLGKWLK